MSGDIERVRADLSDEDAEPCLEPVQFSTAELERTQNAIGAIWNTDDFVISSTGSGNAYNRVTVDLVAADAVTIRRLARVVDDPEILLVFGNNLVLIGT